MENKLNPLVSFRVILKTCLKPNKLFSYHLISLKIETFRDAFKELPGFRPV